MARRKAVQNNNLNKNNKGQGHGKEYIPGLTVRDVPSKGLSTRITGWKTGRVHHFLSLGELNYFYCLEWSESVVDIREQFLLPLDRTLEIAERLGIKHPTIPRTNEWDVMSTDFLIDIEIESHVRLKARTFKQESDLSSKRKIEKLEIERMFWTEQGIDWGIVTEKEIPEELIHNIKWIHSAKELSSGPGITRMMLEQIELKLYDLISKYQAPIARIALEVDNQLGLSPGTSLWAIRYFIANRIWLVDMKTQIDTGSHLNILRRYEFSNMVAGDAYDVGC